VGAITGIVVDAIAGGLRMGLVGAIVTGVLGAILSGWLFNTFLSGWVSKLLGFHYLSGFIGLIAEAFIGAMAFLLISSIFQK